VAAVQEHADENRQNDGNEDFFEESREAMFHPENPPRRRAPPEPLRQWHWAAVLNREEASIDRSTGAVALMPEDWAATGASACAWNVHETAAWTGTEPAGPIGAAKALSKIRHEARIKVVRRMRYFDWVIVDARGRELSL